jgi:TATA-binding protein-associated factor Taf7
MAQKFTVDPRLLAAVSGGAPVKHEDDDAIPDSDAEGTDDEASAQAQAQAQADAKKKKRELLDRLAAEYEESLAKAKADAESGDGCLMCSG